MHAKTDGFCMATGIKIEPTSWLERQTILLPAVPGPQIWR
jgi:hypothetical protein